MPAFQDSDSLAEFFKWFYGEELPGLWPERFAVMGQALHEVAGDLDAATLEFFDGVSTIRSGLMGETEKAFVESAEGMADSLEQAPDYVRLMAQMMTQFAALFQYVIITVMLITALLLFELIVALKLLWINPAALTEWLAKAPTVQKGFTALFQQVVKHAALTSAFNILYELLVDVTAQLANRGKGYQRGWSGKSTGDSLKSGGLESLVGLGFGGGKRLGRQLGIGSKGGVKGAPAPGKGGKAALAGAGLAGNAGEELTTEVIVGLVMNGKVDNNILAPTVVSSGLQGMTFGGISAGRDALAGGGGRGHEEGPQTSGTSDLEPDTIADTDPVSAYEPPPAVGLAPALQMPAQFSQVDPNPGATAGAGVAGGPGIAGGGPGMVDGPGVAGGFGIAGGAEVVGGAGTGGAGTGGAGTTLSGAGAPGGWGTSTAGGSVSPSITSIPETPVGPQSGMQTATQFGPQTGGQADGQSGLEGVSGPATASDLPGVVDGVAGAGAVAVDGDLVAGGLSGAGIRVGDLSELASAEQDPGSMVARLAAVEPSAGVAVGVDVEPGSVDLPDSPLLRGVGPDAGLLPATVSLGEWGSGSGPASVVSSSGDGPRRVRRGVADAGAAVSPGAVREDVTAVPPGSPFPREVRELPPTARALSAAGADELTAAGSADRRLAQWVTQVEQPSSAVDGSPLDDCVPRAWGAFTALHGRAANRTLDDGAPRNPHLTDLVHALGGELTPAADIPRLSERLLDPTDDVPPHTMVLVAAQPPNQPRHVFWLYFDGADGKVTPRWIDTQHAGQFRETVSPTDQWSAMLALPDTKILVLDHTGYPTTINHLLPATAPTQPEPSESTSRTTEALLDPPTTTRHGMSGRGRSAPDFALHDRIRAGAEDWLLKHKIPSERAEHMKVAVTWMLAWKRTRPEDAADINIDKLIRLADQPDLLSAMQTKPAMLVLWTFQPELVETIFTDMPNVFNSLMLLGMPGQPNGAAKVIKELGGTLATLHERFNLLSEFERKEFLRDRHLEGYRTIRLLQSLHDHPDLMTTKSPSHSTTDFLLETTTAGRHIADHPNPALAFAKIDRARGVANELVNAAIDSPGLDQTEKVIQNLDVIDVLTRNPAATRTVLRVPGMLDAVIKDPKVSEIAEILNKNADFAEALIDSPRLGTRLAKSTLLLHAAVANRAVMKWISQEPTKFDSVKDGNLLDALNRATDPPLVSPDRLKRINNPVLRQALVADAENTAGGRGGEGLIAKMGTIRGLKNILDKAPPLLAYPHEYRTLLRNDDLTRRLVDDPRLQETPGLLRAVMRSSDLIKLFGKIEPRPSRGWALADALNPQKNPQTADSAARALLRSNDLRAKCGSGLAPLLKLFLGNPAFLVAIERDDQTLSSLNDSYEAFFWYMDDDKEFLRHVSEMGPLGDLLYWSSGFRDALAGEKPSRVSAKLARHPEVVAIFAKNPSQLEEGHWSALLNNESLFDYLATGEGIKVARVLASNPALLLEFASRTLPQSVTEYQTLFDGKSDPVDDASSTGGDPHAPLRQAITGLGPKVLSPEGVPVGPRELEWVARFFSTADVEGGTLGVVVPEQLVTLHRQVRSDPQLLAATQRSPGLTLALSRSPRLADLLLDRPALFALIVDPADANDIVVAMLQTPELFYAMRDNYHLFDTYTSMVDLRANLTTPNFAKNLASNPAFATIFANPVLWDRYIEIFGRELPASVVMPSPALTNALLRDEKLVAPLSRPEFVTALSSQDESVKAAVASSSSLLVFLSAWPQLVFRLQMFSELRSALQKHRYELSNPVYASLLGGPLWNQLWTHREQVNSVFSSLEMVATAAMMPGVVAVMAQRPGVADLLRENRDVLRLLWQQPKVIDYLSSMDDLVPALRSAPALVAFMSVGVENSGLIADNPHLLSAFRANRRVVEEFVESAGLRGALVANRGLAEALGSRELRQVKRRQNLLRVVAGSGAAAVVDAQTWRELLSNHRMLHRLDSEPDFATTFLADQDLVELYRQDPDHFVYSADRLIMSVRSGSSLTVSDFFAQEKPQKRPVVAQIDPVARPVAGPVAGPVGASARVPQEVAAVSALAGAVNASVAVRELLRTPGRGAVMAALATEAELLPLVVARPDIASELTEQPARLDTYLFVAFLREREASRPWKNASFEQDFAAFVDARDFALVDPAEVKKGAQVTWSREQATWAGQRAQAESQRRQRVSRLNPIDSSTWTMSGRVRYGGLVTAESFTAEQSTVLQRVAVGEAVREGTLTLHTALHAHLDSGAKGASFTYVVADDGMVDVLVYGKSETRQGNAYMWTGGDYRNGPLEIWAVTADEAFTASQDAVKNRAATPAGEPHTSDATAAARPPATLDTDAALRTSILEHYQAQEALRALSTTAAAATPAAAGSSAKKNKKKKKKTTTAQTPQPAAAQVTPLDLAHERVNQTRHNLMGHAVVPTGDGLNDSTTITDDATAQSQYPWLTTVNPSASATNCILTALTSDISLKSESSAAPPDAAQPESSLINYQRDELGLTPTDNPPIYRMNHTAIRDTLAAAPPGERGIVLVRHTTGSTRTAHAFNVIRDTTGVVFLDGQTGGLAQIPDQYNEWLFLPLSANIPPPTTDDRVHPNELTGTATGLNHPPTTQPQSRDPHTARAHQRGRLTSLPAYGPTTTADATSSPMS